MWPSLPCEDDAMREQVPEELLMRKTLMNIFWTFFERPEVGDAALNLHLENCLAITVMPIVRERQQTNEILICLYGKVV